MWTLDDYGRQVWMQELEPMQYKPVTFTYSTNTTTNWTTLDSNYYELIEYLSDMTPPKKKCIFDE
jgi:hypothetical protein